MSVLEKEIEDRVVVWAQKHGFLTPKVKFPERGWPDRLFISPAGHTIFIEFKRPGEVPEAIQAYRIATLTKRNIPAFWTTNFDGALTILKTALGPEGLSETSNSPVVRSSVRRVISGPRSGQDVDGPSYYKDTHPDQPYKESPDRSAISSDQGRVAEGNREMGGLPSDEMDDSPWPP